MTLEGVCEVESVGEVERTGFERVLEKVDIRVLVGVMEGPFTQGQKIGGEDLMDDGAFDFADRLALVDDNDISIYSVERLVPVKMVDETSHTKA